jgi:hypothetical protein
MQNIFVWKKNQDGRMTSKSDKEKNVLTFYCGYRAYGLLFDLAFKSFYY